MEQENFEIGCAQEWQIIQGIGSAAIVQLSTAMASQADELRARVKRFATRALKFVKTMPRDVATDAVARQLARSAPSVSANYHSAGRSRSHSEFTSRLAIVADEADETEGWLGQLKNAGLASGTELDWLLDESRELRAIFVQAARTARLNDKATRDKKSGDVGPRRKVQRRP